MMIDKGGPAFPTDNEAQTGPNTYHFEGMTLRDYFAAKSLPMQVSFGGNKDHAEAVARMAYMYADAMMKARGE